MVAHQLEDNQFFNRAAGKNASEKRDALWGM